MARPLKDGANYFPKDIDFYTDDKVRLLRAEFGAKGMYMLDYLLCEIYKSGYYIQWDDDKCALVSDGAGCGCTPEFVGEFVNGCIRRSFFNKGVFDMFGVLTSAGIQRRFIRMLNQRTKYTFIEEYFLLDIDDTDDVPEGILNKLTFKKIISNENSIINNENPVINTDNTQIKENQNKTEKNIVDNSNRSTAVAAIVASYQQNIGMLSPKVAEQLTSWLDTVDVSLILYAIDQAVENGVRKPVYIYSILQNQYACGITTREQAEAAKVERQSKKSTGKKNTFQDYGSDGYETDLAITLQELGVGDNNEQS